MVTPLKVRREKLLTVVSVYFLFFRKFLETDPLSPVWMGTVVTGMMIVIWPKNSPNFGSS